METYTARVEYLDADDNLRITEVGGLTMEFATAFVAEKFKDIMLHWPAINPNGVKVYGEVADDDGDFCDCYELCCGM